MEPGWPPGIDSEESWAPRAGFAPPHYVRERCFGLRTRGCRGRRARFPPYNPSSNSDSRSMFSIASDSIPEAIA